MSPSPLWISLTACCPLQCAHVHFGLILRGKTAHHDLAQAYALAKGISGQSQKSVTNVASEFSTCSTLRTVLLSLAHSFVLEHKVFYIGTKGKHIIGVPMNVNSQTENKQNHRKTPNP